MPFLPRRDAFGSGQGVYYDTSQLIARPARLFRFQAMSTPRKTLRPKAKKPQAKKLQNWRVVRLRATPVAELGTIKAASAEEAIKRAIQQYDIKPAQRDRLAAYPSPLAHFCNTLLAQWSR